MKIAENVYKIDAGCNVYLILDSKITLIDTGSLTERDVLKENISKIISPDKIDDVILTHLHYDHCGNLTLFPNAKFYASKEEIEDFIKNPKNFFFGKVPDEIKDILFKDVNKIQDKINDLDVIRVPGHTRGSIALLYKKRNILFSGDTIFRDGIGRYDLPNSVPDEIMNSVEMLSNMVKEKGLTLCPGHDY